MFSSFKESTSGLTMKVAATVEQEGQKVAESVKAKGRRTRRRRPTRWRRRLRASLPRWVCPELKLRLRAARLRASHWATHPSARLWTTPSRVLPVTRCLPMLPPRMPRSCRCLSVASWWAMCLPQGRRMTSLRRPWSTRLGTRSRWRNCRMGLMR